MSEVVNQTPEMTEQQVSELLQVRRDKLAALCEAGQNPYEITKFNFNAYQIEHPHCVCRYGYRNGGSIGYCFGT